MVEPERNSSQALWLPSLRGRLYWLAVLPFHSFIFPAMARNITAAAQEIASA